MSENRSDDESKKTPSSILRANLTGGPMGLGNPEDRSIRKAELQFLVGDVVRRESQKLCHEEMKLFADCASNAGFGVFWKCVQEKNIYNNCLLKWKNDPEFFEKCKEQYLDIRSEYRRTGVSKTDIRHRVNRAQRVEEAKEILEKARIAREKAENVHNTT